MSESGREYRFSGMRSGHQADRTCIVTPLDQLMADWANRSDRQVVRGAGLSAVKNLWRRCNALWQIILGKEAIRILLGIRAANRAAIQHLVKLAR